MSDLIVIAGSPGSGKSTTARLLHENLASPYIEFSSLREFHLDREWMNESPEEERMAFENLIFIIKNYIRNGYRNIIVTDLKDFRVCRIPEIFAGFDFVIFTLFARDEEIKRRIIKRNEGFKNAGQAVEWNQLVQKRPLLENEYRIGNKDDQSLPTANEILKILQKREDELK